MEKSPKMLILLNGSRMDQFLWSEYHLKYQQYLKIISVFSVMTTISWNSVPSDPYPGLNPDITRVKTVIETISNYGVDKKFMFSVEDLYDAQHIPRVVRCLEEVEKMVSKLS